MILIPWKKLRFYKVSQQVWDTLRNVCEQSELRLQKMCCRTKKLLFEQVFVICKIKLCTFKQFFLFCNLLSKLKYNCFKVHKLILQIAKTCSKSNYFVRQHMIYLNVARFTRKHFWASEHYISFQTCLDTL